MPNRKSDYGIKLFSLDTVVRPSLTHYATRVFVEVQCGIVS